MLPPPCFAVRMVWKSSDQFHVVRIKAEIRTNVSLSRSTVQTRIRKFPFSLRKTGSNSSRVGFLLLSVPGRVISERVQQVTGSEGCLQGKQEFRSSVSSRIGSHLCSAEQTGPALSCGTNTPAQRTPVSSETAAEILILNDRIHRPTVSEDEDAALL